MNYKKLYIELGKLLYAVAKADGQVQAQERTALKEIVKDQLAPLEPSIDAFGSDKAFYAEFEFETLDAANISYQEALASFIHYVHLHQNLFNDQLIKLTFDAVKHIANAYKGTSKMETEIIDQLNKEFKLIKVKKS